MPPFAKEALLTSIARRSEAILAVALTTVVVFALPAAWLATWATRRGSLLTPGASMVF